MAVDITNGINLKVTDGVSVSVTNKLKNIASDSRLAADNIGDLQAKLNSINAAGISGVGTAIRSVATATGTLTNNQTKYASAAAKSVTATNNMTFALGKLEGQAAAAAANISKLQQATLGYNTAARSVVSTSNAAANAVSNQGKATQSTVGATMAASNTIGMLEGRTLSANRAAAQFAVKILGLGPILQAAFVVTGALALLEVLIQIAQAVNNVVRAYKDMQLASAQASIQAIEDGEKIIKVHSSVLSAANAARFLAGRKSDYGTVTTVTQIQPLIEEAQANQQVAASIRNKNEAGMKGAALDRQKHVDALASVDDLVKERDAIQKVADQLKAQRLEQVKSTTIGFTPHKGFGGGYDLGKQEVSTNKVTDPAAIKQIETNFKGATEEVKRLNTAIIVMKNNAEADTKREAAAQIKDDTKAAIAQMKKFEDQLANMRKGDKVVTPQATLAFWQGKEKVALPGNKDAIDSKEGSAQQAIDRQVQAYDELNTKLQDQVADIGLYSDALKIKRDVDKDVLTLTKAGVEVNDQMTASITTSVTAIVQSSKYAGALGAIYEQYNGPLAEYNASLKALGNLYAADAVTGSQFENQANFINQTYQDAIDPLNAYNRALKQQQELTATRGTTQQQAVNTQVVQLSQNLQNGPQHINKTDADAMAASKRADIAASEAQKVAQEAYNAVLNEQAGALQKLTDAQTALTQARANDKITEDAYQGSMIKITNEILHQHEAMGDATYQQQAKGALTNYAKDYTSTASAIGKVYDQTFKTIADGAADSIGRAIVYADNLNDALKDVARQALQEIISGLIKVAIQWAITKFFHQDNSSQNQSAKAMATQTAASIAAITAITTAQMVAINLLSEPAWTLAEAVSIFSFGAADAAAITGMAAVKTAGTAAKFAGGGYVNGPGTGTSDSIPAKLSNGEYVWDAKTTAANFNMISGIHKGTVRTFSAGGFVGAQTSSTQQASNSMTIEFHDHVGVAIRTERVGENRVRAIVNEMGPGLVAQHAPGVIANELQNPNSKPSKAIRNNVTTSRIF